MKTITDQNNPGLTKGDALHGYTIKAIAPLQVIDSVLYELEHDTTGARHIHISNKDAENTFSVAFKTVPQDSTGVAHILEHTALCGSRQFPVRDPFFSMLKRSLSTFMNAFTASDWTMYPFSTQNSKDFYNLADVYLDSAFYPNIDELSFKQEGHRLEIEQETQSDNSRLVYKGVVYNEMKGAMSSPNQVMARSLMNALYPDVTYRHNSGGEPSVIPSLTHADLVTFHHRHYHPSNAFFYTYGNLPLEKHLQFINTKILSHFERIDPRTDVPRQPRWSEPRTASYPYPLGPNENPEKKYQVCVAWLCADIKDSFEVLVLTLLEQILLGNSSSPLRRALIESGLGSALSDGSGFDPDNRDTLFACGLKDVKKTDAPAIETIISDVLNNLSSNGIESERIESAIHQIEFHRKEVTNTPYPYGIKLLLMFAGNWFHGGEPSKNLNIDADLKKLRAALEQGNFLENRIKQYFLENSHRVLFTLTPDQTLAAKETELTEQELDDLKNQLDEADLKKIASDTDALKKLQETGEDLSCLPTLALNEIPPSIQKIKSDNTFSDASATCYTQPTAGIVYFAAATGAGALPQKLLPLTSLFCSTLPRMGTAKRDYAQMAQRISLYTGGIGLAPAVRTCFDTSQSCIPFTAFSGKCLERNQAKMFAIIEELLCQYAFTDLDRLKSILFEYRAGLESMVVQNGHHLAMALSCRHFSPTLALSEIWQGIHQLKSIKALTDRIANPELAENQLEQVAADLVEIGQILFKQENFKMGLVGEESMLSDAVPAVTALRNQIQTGAKNGFTPPNLSKSEKESNREGWSTATAVAFVASTFKTVRLNHKDAPALSVVAKLLRSLYLHREIREKGGAYGGFALYNGSEGVFSLASYRDPHIVNTLDVFAKAADFICSGRYTDEDIKEAVLQVCSVIDKPDTPAAAARKAFYRNLISLSDETREQYKTRLLALTRKDVVRVAQKYFDRQSNAPAIAVIAGKEQLQNANAKLGEQALTLEEI
ncbi:insulinase family protein [Desulfococcaceae bacterium HSG9]|nr:insulinase family protein [Desulfococcaceae bacterium HSG9]